VFAFTKVPLEMSGFMINVILPSNDKELLASVHKDLDEKHGIYAVFGCVNTDCDKTIYFTRLSMQVYIELDDVEIFGNLVLKLLHDRECVSKL
jgi:hypothetical protein